MDLKILVPMTASKRIITIAIALFIYIVAIVVAQKDVVINVEQVKGNPYPYHIYLNKTLFIQFHECLGKGAATCDVVYGWTGCPECTAESVRASDQTSTQEWNNYYECKNVNLGGKPYLSCQIRTDISTIPGKLPPETYRLPDSVNYSSVCFGFVWNSDEEGIKFTSNQLQVEICGSDCACPGRNTTPQPGTKSTSSSQSSTSTTEPTAPSQSRPSIISTASLGTPSTKPPTKSTSTILTTSSSSSSTQFSSHSKNAGDGAPTGVIVGAAVGVIVIIVIIIVIIVVWRKRRSKAESSGHVDHETLASSSNGAGMRRTTNEEKSSSHYNTEFSGNNFESHTPGNGVINGYQNSLHQPSMVKTGVAPEKNLPKPQFAVKNNDSDFGYSTAQLVVPEDSNTKDKKSRDDYNYVYAEDDRKCSDPNPQTTRDKTPVVSLPKVRDDYAVVVKTRKHKYPGSTDTNMSDYDDIPEEDYGYSHAEGDPSAQDTNKAAGTLPGTSDLHQSIGYESSRTSDGYTTVGNVNQSNPNNDDPNATSVYSRLHDPVRDIQNPYNVGPDTNDVYSKLHEEVRVIKNPYNVLPEAQGASDSNNALPDTAHNAQDTKKQKLSKSLPYGPQDYAVVVKTKSNQPAQSTFELGDDDK